MPGGKLVCTESGFQSKKIDLSINVQLGHRYMNQSIHACLFYIPKENENFIKVNGPQSKDAL